MNTFSNGSMTRMVSNMESNLNNSFDAIIDGSYFDKIKKEFEYCMIHPKFKKQVIKVIVDNRKKHFLIGMGLVNLNCSTNTKTTTDNEIDDEIYDATTNEFYERKKRFIQLQNTCPELHIMIS